jgi:hypothetical protein
MAEAIVNILGLTPIVLGYKEVIFINHINLTA